MNNEQNYKDEKHWSSTVSLGLGIASIFLWEFSLIPILAIIFGGVGLARSSNKWYAGIGLALGIIFLMVRVAKGNV